ncbi:helix-turn-helix transcriptional regulator [Burkholderia multivorans]|uniref:helix-turn-helix transcriptional regulator n=1 Tax=Burkholderia multivorans TaxID=87883 RepID=UPI0021578E27|nr:AlpA family phage regulatory protein [Burkholderia multivorans]
MSLEIPHGDYGVSSGNNGFNTNLFGVTKMGNAQNLGLDAYLRISQLVSGRFVPFSKPTVWRKVREGTFPAPVKLSAGVTAWKLSDIQEWQRAQAEAASAQ